MKKTDYGLWFIRIFFFETLTNSFLLKITSITFTGFPSVLWPNLVV